MTVNMKFIVPVLLVVFLPLTIASDSTNVATRNGLNAEDDVQTPIQTTDAVVQQLLRRVEQLETRNEAQQLTIQTHLSRIEHLESRDNDQQQLIMTIRTELDVQRRRTEALEVFRARISKCACQPENKKKGVSRIEDKIGKNLTVQTASEDLHKTPSRIRRADNEENIAFFATLTSHLQHAGVQQIFVFDRVVTNLGNGYNNHNGNFVAPVSGTYVFSATLLSLYHQSSHSQFTKNGKAVSYMFVSGSEAGYDTTSQMIVVQLQRGDDICIRNIDADKSYHGGHYSTFSGFLLQQDFSDQAVVGRK